jgi:choline dehydrogenase-like flavoprotein
MAERYDVCVVGSGAGGGIAAYVLAKSGARVLVLEKGPWLTEDDFGDDELRFGERNLIDQDPLIEPRTFRDRPEEGPHQFVGKVLPVSRCVGGGSVHYGAVCFRFRPEDFRARSTWGNLPGADVVDWPLAYDDLLPAYRSVERLIGVAGGQMRGEVQPGAPVADAEWRTDRYPMPGHPPNYPAKLFEDASRTLGLHPFPTPVAINNGSYDGRPGCSYCGFCSSHGCPIGAKGDTRVTALAKAVATGRCEIRSDAYVYHVEVSRGRAKRVLYVDGEGRRRAVEANTFVLACSTVDTPRLVLLSDMPRDLVNHDVVGRYLQIHHFPGGVGFFNDRLDYYRGFWSMRCLDDFYLGPPGSPAPMFGFGNLQTIGPSSGYPILAGGIISTAKTAGWGLGHKSFMRETFGRFQFLGMIGQDPPVRTNVVDLDPTVTDVFGFPVARITYSHHANDYAVQTAMIPWLEAIFFGMGATSFQPVIPFAIPTGIPQLGKTDAHRRGFGRQLPNPIGGAVNHQMGTMRMGHDPDSSVIDPGGRFHGIPNLYVADGSVLPTSGGYNPTLTIQALAWRTASRIARAN